MSALAPTAPQGRVNTTPSRSCSPNPSNSSPSDAAAPPTSISKDELLSSGDECIRVIYQFLASPDPEVIPVADESGAASSLPATARAVVIGAGIVGNCLVAHLARLGWKDLILIDKGPLPNPGGSTGHASNFIFPVDHSREMTDLTADSVRQYEHHGVITVCGGLEVARTEERMEELRRRMASAKSWGIEGCSLVTPAEIKELVPFVNESVLVGR